MSVSPSRVLRRQRSQVKQQLEALTAEEHPAAQCSKMVRLCSPCARSAEQRALSMAVRSCLAETTVPMASSAARWSSS